MADTGANTLVDDADRQPSLTKYYDRFFKRPLGTVEVPTQGTITNRCISGTSFRVWT